MPVSVTYLGDGDVGEAVVYGLPFVVGEAVTLPDGFEFTDKILNNGTFAAVTAETPMPAAAPVFKRKGRPPRAGQ